MTDELFRLPHSRVPQIEVYDAFPHDVSSRNPQENAGPTGGTLDGILPTDLTPASADEQVRGEQGSAMAAGTVKTSMVSTTWTKEGTFYWSRDRDPAQVAGPAAIKPATPTRRSTLQRQHSLRLQLLGERDPQKCPLKPGGMAAGARVPRREDLHRRHRPGNSTLGWAGGAGWAGGQGRPRAYDGWDKEPVARRSWSRAPSEWCDPS